MNANRLQSLALALFLISAMGVSATTIESSLSTDPDDVIDIDPSWLPIGGDSLVDAKDEMVSNAESGSSDSDGSDAEGSTQPSENGDRTEAASREPDSGALEDASGKAEQELASVAGQASEELEQSTTPETGLLDRLLDLLRPVLVALLVLGALLVLFVVGRRYADRLGALFARDSVRDDGPAWPPEEPEEEVSRAWLAMVRRIEADRPRTRTPEEWASSGVDAGMDPDAVEELTRTFAEVRYGDEPPTASRRQRAWVNLERVRTTFERRSR